MTPIVILLEKKVPKGTPDWQDIFKVISAPDF
jgi:hypothetical protein